MAPRDVPLRSESSYSNGNNQNATIPPRTYRPYQNSPLLLEAPLFHRVLEPFCLEALRPVIGWLYRLRWALAHPLHTPLVPLLCRSRFLSEWVPRLVNITVGELLLYMPLVIWFLLGYHYSYVEPSTSDSGYMAAYALYMCFLTANKSNSLFSFVFGLPFDRLVPFHLASAIVAFTIGCFHTHVAYVYGGDDDGDSDHASFGSDPNRLKFLVDTDTNLTGALLLGGMLGLLALSLCSKLRRVFYNFWLMSHIVFAVLVLVMLMMHRVRSSVFVVAWFVLDYITRYAVMACCQNKATAQLRRIGKGDRKSHEPAVEIRIPKRDILGFDYRPGQFCQIAIPKLSMWEFHPISISSAPHEEYVTFHVRDLGDWTHALVELVHSGVTETCILIEGPYGSLMVNAEDDNRYQMALMVSGGIGVTPCQSIGKDLLHQHYAHGRNLKSLKFVWAVRDATMVDDIPPLGNMDDFSTHNASYQAFLEKQYRRRSTKSGKTAEFQVSDDCDDEVATSSSNTTQSPALVQVDIYQTRDPVDPEKQYNYNVLAGRPDLDAIFEELTEQALELGETNVAVFGCGPARLMADVQDACRRYSSTVVGCGGQVIFFDFHEEKFEL